jgi:hypothetical protein
VKNKEKNEEEENSHENEREESTAVFVNHLYTCIVQKTVQTDFILINWE